LHKSFIENAGYSDNINFATALADILNKVNGNRQEYLCTKEVAEHIGINRATVYEWVKKGLLPEPEKRDGMNPRWRKTDIDTALNSRTTAKGTTKDTTKNFRHKKRSSISRKTLFYLAPPDGLEPPT
jgi:excisionase family DNA binding protein